MSSFLENILPKTSGFSRTFRVLFAGLLVLFLAASCDSSENGETPDDGETPGNGLLDSGTLGPGETFSFTFSDEGTFPYYCEFHPPNMTGTVTVEADAAQGDAVTISMVDLTYSPRQITVRPGTQITWVNEDAVNHTVTSGQPGGAANDGSVY